MARLRTSNEIGDDGKLKRFFTARPKNSKEKEIEIFFKRLKYKWVNGSCQKSGLGAAIYIWQ